MPTDKQITIILPSFRDPRLLDAIASIRAFDDIGTVRLAVVDGGSDPALVTAIGDALAKDDILVSEPDQGIFDALNKGLALADTAYIGWLGADDLFTGEIKASDVVRELAEADLFVASAYVVRGDWIRRKTHARPSALGLARLGLHNPHYSTFGRSTLLKSERFDIGLLSADIEYFLKLFAKNPRVAATDKVLLIAAEGGFSTGSWAKAFRINRSVYDVYARRSNPIVAFVGVGVKTGYKMLSVIRYRIWKRHWPSLHPEAVPARARAEG